MVETIIQDKESRSTLYEEVFESLDDTWTTEGPGGRPIKAKALGMSNRGNIISLGDGVGRQVVALVQG